MSNEFELTSEEDGSSFPRGHKTSDIKTAIIEVTKKGNLRISKDEVWQYWQVLKSADFFERLFLDIDNSALITNEVISYHYEEIRSYLEKWKERESAGINFSQSHGGYPLRELERNLEEAYLNLKNRTSREEYLNSYSEEKKKQAVKSLEPIIKMALADGVLTYDEKTLIYQEGLKFGLNIRDIDNLIDLQKRIFGKVTDETINVTVNAADNDAENKNDPDLLCPNCKEKIDPDAFFCGECGIKIAPDSDLKPFAEEIASNSYERPSPADVSERNAGALSGSADKEDPGHLFSFYFRRFFPSVVLLHYLICILDEGIRFSAMGDVLQRLFFVDSFLIAFSIFTGRKLKAQHPEAYRITKFFLISLILFSLFPGNYNFRYLQRHMYDIFGWDAGVAELKFVWSILSVFLYGFIYRKFTKSPALANLYNTGKDSATNIVKEKLEEDNNFLALFSSKITGKNYYFLGAVFITSFLNLNLQVGSSEFRGDFINQLLLIVNEFTFYFFTLYLNYSFLQNSETVKKFLIKYITGLTAYQVIAGFLFYKLYSGLIGQDISYGSIYLSLLFNLVYSSTTALLIIYLSKRKAYNIFTSSLIFLLASLIVSVIIYGDGSTILWLMEQRTYLSQIEFLGEFIRIYLANIAFGTLMYLAVKYNLESKRGAVAAQG